MRTINRFAWAALGLLVIETAHAASFDCHKAATKVEKLICGDAELSRLDEELSAAYKAALTDAKHADYTRQSQKNWMRQRNLCPAVECVKRSYEMMLSWLKLPVATFPAGKPITARASHTATLLPNGKVLVAGGDGEYEALNSAELYDPATNRFAATGNLIVGRAEHSATLLPNGKVVIAGGKTTAGPHMVYVDGEEVYDPATGTFSATKGIPIRNTATSLPDGKVLLAGGDHADIYDPATGHASATDNLVTSRTAHTATLLPTGKVLLAGGAGEHGGALASAELYDPATNRFAATASMATARTEHTATLLPNGKVLVAGGVTLGTPLASAELYDPATGRFTPTGNLVTARYGHSAILLQNGNVLIAGGAVADGSVVSLELYDPATGTFSSIGRLASSYFGSATLLQNGKVLFVEGNIAELYDPAAGNN